MCLPQFDYLDISMHQRSPLLKGPNGSSEVSESEVLLKYGELVNTSDTVVVQGNEKIENFAFLQNWPKLALFSK